MTSIPREQEKEQEKQPTQSKLVAEYIRLKKEYEKNPNVLSPQELQTLNELKEFLESMDKLNEQLDTLHGKKGQEI